MNLSPDWRHRLDRLATLLIGLTALAATVALWQWYRDEGGFEAVYVAVGVLFAALLATRRWLKKEPETAAAGLLTWTRSPAGGDALPALRRQMGQVFNLDDLRTVAFDLHLNYDNLAGETLDRKIISLLETCRSQNRLPDLLAHLQRERSHVEWVYPGRQPLAAAPQEVRSRQNLLNHVQTAWIDGFLKQSLHSEVIKLSLSYRPDALGQRPWQLVLQQTGQPDQPVPPEHSLAQIFDAAGRNLLILGAPGSGKSITMLQLAESLIDAARDDPAEPLPIVLNLSSWAQWQGALADWLVEEIFIQYGAAKDLTRAWIGGNRLLYLLDGLDEVAESARDNCITAINAFKEQYPAEMVVCSRSEDYEKLKNRLRLGTAVHIQPLSEAEIEAHLDQEELELRAVRATLAHDPDLYELAQTPLMLSLMTLAYRGLTCADLRPLASKEARRHHLFDHYMVQMFSRRPLPPDSLYTQQEALDWLANLARGVAQHEQSIFYIERLQATWLPTDTLRRSYALRVGMLTGAIVGLIITFAIQLISWLNFGISNWLISILLFGIPTGLFVGRQNMRKAQKHSIELSEKINWITLSIREFFREVGLILVGGILTATWLGAVLGEPVLGMLFGLVVVFGFGLPVILLASIKTSERESIPVPNQGVRKSLYHALTMGMLFGLLLGLIFGFQGVLIGGLLGRLTSWTVTGFSIGFVHYGGFAVVQHYALRYLLAKQHFLPFPFQDGRLVAFLDAMHGRILLRRVGGGWIFVHRTLLEYFAGLAEAPK